MELYLVQHGPAKSEAEDPERPLTEEGRLLVERMAAFLAPLGLQLLRIEHSDRLRARQTAEIFAATLRPAEGLREVAGMAPNDDPGPLVARLEVATGNLMLVGHLPHLNRLVSSLLGLSSERPAVEFQMGGVVRLDRVRAGQWVIRWMITPDLLVALRGSVGSQA
ncbi:MAG: phosphohistidine phosphatase SixA [Bryobacterales bacterium]|nr:phosphohistidine phosphatase SixA [Bryobacteraceae bacterium]MDW8129585.1 phosphohistidine phosphatase SixA [Bryobacterales bacterium]